MIKKTTAANTGIAVLSVALEEISEETMDKIEIEAVAKEIGTYEISIRPGHGCSIVPMKPITEANPEKVTAFSEKIDLDALARAAADAAKLV